MPSSPDKPPIFDKVTNFLDPAFANLHRTMIDAAPDCILLVGLDGRVLMMNHAARAAAALAPNEPDERSWFDFSPPESLEDCRRHFFNAVAGDIVRFPLTTSIAGTTTYWDIVFSPVRNPDGQVAFILSVGRDVTSNHVLDIALVQAAAREKLVTQEMQHRIKNLFSVVSVLITMAEREAKADGKPETLAPTLKAKMSALARASEATYLNPESACVLLPNEEGHSIELPRLVGAILAPYSSMVSLKGRDISTSRKNITTLTLFLHELATNSVKYGALGHEKGHVTIEYALDADTLRLCWSESGGPVIKAAPSGSGFGSQMIDRLISLAGGTIQREWRQEGLETKLTLPN